MQKWLREPLVHFLALGAGLFLLFALVRGDQTENTNRIEISSAQIELLAERFARTWQRSPSPRELAGIVDDHIREEIYYREAMAMGLDRDDTIIRRRLRQKLEFFTDDMLATVEPGEQELQAYLAENAEKFRIAGRISFEHVYFSQDRRGERAEDDAKRALANLRADPDADSGEVGDGLPLPPVYADTPTDRIDSRFGSGFAAALAALPVGEWSGPIRSAYGLHLARVSRREPGELPTFELARDVVEREWRAERRVEAKEAFYQGLSERYDVVIEDFVESDETAVAGTAAGPPGDTHASR